MSDTEPDVREIELTNRAREKEFRYLKGYEMVAAVRRENDVWSMDDPEKFAIRVEREKHHSNWNGSRTETIVLIVAVKADGRAVVISQTGDHYDWSDFERVDGLPETGGYDGND